MAMLIIVINWAIVIVFIAFAIIVLIRLYQVDMTGLISELDASSGARKASLSRFQFLLFTFVVGGLFLALSIQSKTFVEIPNGVLGLIGISGGSFVISKGISGKSNGTANPAAGGQGTGGQGAGRPGAGGPGAAG